jgi:hypothetical protein
VKTSYRQQRRQVLRTTPAPAGLEAWLDAVNGLPADPIALMLLSNGISQLWVARENGTESEREAGIRQLKQESKGWGATAVAYIFRDDTGPQEPGERLGELVSAWITLRHIAEFGALEPRSDQAVTILNPPGAGAQLKCAQGRLSVEISPFLRMLDGVEARRIRLCPVCDRLFWAGRRDKRGCTGKCSGVLRQRSLRTQQRENRAFRKRRRLRGKEKQNG